MELPKRNERVVVFQKADAEFSDFIHRAQTKMLTDGVTHQDVITCYAQITINLMTHSELQLSNFQKLVENYLMLLTDKYTLTGAEMLDLVASAYKKYTSALVAMERNGTL